jgi:hypothetical protein
LVLLVLNVMLIAVDDDDVIEETEGGDSVG